MFRYCIEDWMRCKAELRIEFETPGEARAVASSLEPEDGDYISTKVEGRSLHAAAEADNPKSLMHTLDDYLACASVAIKASSSAPQRPRAP
jgi:hypothetical protein